MASTPQYRPPRNVKPGETGRGRGSFGGKNQSKSALEAPAFTGHALQSTRRVSNDAEGRARISPASCSYPDRTGTFPTTGNARNIIQQEDFPELGAASISSSRRTSLSTPNAHSKAQQGLAKECGSGSIPIVQTEEVASFSGRSRVPFNNRRTPHLPVNAEGSRTIHYQADEDDDLVSQPRRASKGNNRRKSEVVESRKGFRESSKSRDAQSSDNRGDRGNEDRIYHLGRLMTSILRHRAIELNLSMREDGYVVVEDLLKLAIKTWTGLPLSVFTVDDVRKAVERDNKQRFGFLTENGVHLIRANQGHSIKVVETDKLLKPVSSADEVPVCVHGTLRENLDSILNNGLSRMARNHVHFASGLPREDGVISGMKSHCEILIYLDVEKALQDGMKLYISDNGVILTEGFDGIVPRKYFKQIAEWKRGRIIPLLLNSKS